MGFQTGSTIRPELGNADYSGFANAATITANAYAKLGDQIGAGIEKYKKKKEDAANDEAALAFIKGTGLYSNYTDKEIEAGIKAFGGGSQFSGVLSDIQTTAAKNNYYNAKAEEARRGKVSEKKPISASQLSAFGNVLEESNIGYDEKSGQYFRITGDNDYIPFNEQREIVDMSGVAGSDAYAAMYGRRPNNPMTGSFTPQEGWSIKGGAPSAQDTNETNTVTQKELSSASAEKPSGSRLGLFLDELQSKAQFGSDVISQMGDSAMATPAAVFDYVTKQDQPGFSDTLRDIEDRRRKARLENFVEYDENQL